MITAAGEQRAGYAGTPRSPRPRGPALP